VARLGLITQFLSKPVMDGFVVGLAVFVAVGQLELSLDDSSDEPRRFLIAVVYGALGVAVVAIEYIVAH
jgi:MFS superfamily sulfate permease-like transporter